MMENQTLNQTFIPSEQHEFLDQVIVIIQNKVSLIICAQKLNTHLILGTTLCQRHISSPGIIDSWSNIYMI